MVEFATEKKKNYRIEGYFLQLSAYKVGLVTKGNQNRRSFSHKMTKLGERLTESEVPIMRRKIGG